MPLEDAIAYFFAERGWLPTVTELLHLARYYGFACERRRGRLWVEVCLELGRARILELQLPEPPPYGTRPEEGHWTPLRIDIGPLPPPAPNLYPRVAVIATVREFALTLAGKSPSLWRWKAFARYRADAPSPSVLRRHGGLDQLLVEAARPDWRERAERWVAPVAKTPAQLATENEARLRGRASKPEAEAVVAIIRREGVIGTAEIAAELGWTLDRVRSWLRLLKRAGRIEPTEAFTQSKAQQYRLSAPCP